MAVVSRCFFQFLFLAVAVGDVIPEDQEHSWRPGQSAGQPSSPSGGAPETLAKLDEKASAQQQEAKADDAQREAEMQAWRARRQEAQAKQAAEEIEAEFQLWRSRKQGSVAKKGKAETSLSRDGRQEAAVVPVAQSSMHSWGKAEANAGASKTTSDKRRTEGSAQDESLLGTDSAQEEAATQAADKHEVESIINSWEQARVCVRPTDLKKLLEESKHVVLKKGLPEWNETEVPSKVEDVTIAFLIQASWEEQLPVLRRVFDRLYSPKDLFLYTVDREKLNMSKVINVLPKPLPRNVAVSPSAHSAYYVWPRVEIVLDGLRTLLVHEKKWDFVIHLSESDYPVHGISWIRQSLALQRTTNFIQVFPRCYNQGETGLITTKDDWYWWTQNDALASCGSEMEALAVSGVKFPLHGFERRGFRFAHGTEWMAITRELVKYALSPKLLPYRKLIGTHVGADEIFWQTLVLNIPKFGQKISRQGWYIKWGHGKTDHSPDTLTNDYKDDIQRQRASLLFMRKVNPLDSLEFMNTVDEWIQQGNDAVPGPHEPPQEKPDVAVPSCMSVMVDDKGSRFRPDEEKEADALLNTRDMVRMLGGLNDKAGSFKWRVQILDFEKEEVKAKLLQQADDIQTEVAKLVQRVEDHATEVEKNCKKGTRNKRHMTHEEFEKAELTTKFCRLVKERKAIDEQIAKGDGDKAALAQKRDDKQAEVVRLIDHMFGPAEATVLLKDRLDALEATMADMEKELAKEQKRVAKAMKDAGINYRPHPHPRKELMATYKWHVLKDLQSLDAEGTSAH